MHSLHVGYVGVMGNLHYLEILDFVAGLPGGDLTGDDKAAQIAKTAAALIDGLWIRRSLSRQNPDPESAVKLVERAVFRALGQSDA